MTSKPEAIFTEEQLFSRLQVDGLDIADDMIERAKAGDATAMFAIGNAYYDELNYAMAIIWLRKSAANKNADAMNKLGFIYHSGYGVDVNFAIALEWFLKATKQGHTEAEVHVGNYHYYGIGIHVNKKAAISWYFNAAMKRHPEATERVAKTLVDENKKQSALLWYQKGMDLDNEDAKKGFDDLTRSNYHLDVDQKNLLRVEERLYELEKLKEPTLVDMTRDESSNFNAIMKLMAENKNKLDESNNLITKLEKQNHDNAKSYEKKVYRMKKRITALEEKCLDKGKLKERVVVLENQVEINNRLTDRVKLLECLMANIKMNHLDISDNTGYSTCSSSNVNSDPEVITFDKQGSKNI